MPFRDGTGPDGRGPLTGGARGDCASGASAAVLPDDRRAVPAGYIGRRGTPLGFGRRLFGLGRGLCGGRGRGYGAGNRRRW